MGLHMSQYENCILFLLAKAHQRVYGHFKKRLHPYGLTPVQLLVLVALEEEEGVSAKDLAGRLMFDNATLSGVLDRMAEGGWITKRLAEDDKRLLQIYMAQKAKDVVIELIKEMDDANEKVLHKFNIEEKLLFKRFLRDMQH
jgi:DNA-binding MarR family transcriptional regulator